MCHVHCSIFLFSISHKKFSALRRTRYTRFERTHSHFIPAFSLRVNKFLLCCSPHEKKGKNILARKNEKEISSIWKNFSNSRVFHELKHTHRPRSDPMCRCVSKEQFTPSTTPINERKENYRLKFVCCFEAPSK